MDFKKSGWSSGLRYLSLLAVVLIVTIYGLSWSHYPVFSVNPVAAWHGANMKVRYLLSDTHDESIPYNQKALESVARAGEVKAVSPLDINPEASMDDALLQSNLANIKSFDEKAKQDRALLEKVGEQLAASQQTLGALQKDFSEANVNELHGIATREEVASASLSPEDVPSEEDARLLIGERNRVGTKKVKGIPDKVLLNVQQTTGISPDEINELMNQ